MERDGPMTDTTMARCSRTGAIVEAILEGNEAGLDRAHTATCPTCGREAERAMRFTGGLAATATEASEGIPDAALLGRDGPRLGGRTGRLTVRVMTLAAAVAAGLVIATVIGSRALAPTGRGPSIFGPSVAAQHRLGAMDLACGQRGAVVECKSAAKDHVHRVLLTLDEGHVVGVEARIDSTNGKPLRLDGANWMFGRFAGAVLAPEMRSRAVNWVGDAFSTCGTSCSADFDDLHLELSKGLESVVLTLTAR
jgi:hypothetical protein